MRNSPKFEALALRGKRKATNAKKPMTSNVTASDPINLDEVQAEEGIGSPNTPESSQVSKGKRPMGRKRAKEHLKNKGGDGGSYKNVIEELLVEKK